MAPIVNSDDLEKVMKAAGLGPRNVKKMRDANAGPPESTTARGHGAPGHDTTATPSL